MNKSREGFRVMYTRKCESGDQLTGTVGVSLSSRSSSFPVPFDAFTYSPHLPCLGEPNARRDPSGDQIGDEFSCEASNVTRDVRAREGSITQRSPPFPSCRCAAIL